MMNAILKSFTMPLTNLNPSTNLCRIRARQAFRRLSFDVVLCQLPKPGFRPRLISSHHKKTQIVYVVSANNEDSNSGIEIENTKENEVTIDAVDVSSEISNKTSDVAVLQETWDSFWGLYDKASEMLADNSKKLMIELVKNIKVLNENANKLSRNGAKNIIAVAKNSAKNCTVRTVKGYLLDAAKMQQAPISDILEGCATFDDWKNISGIRDFCLSIPYGLFLSIGGFLDFMLSGSISAIRFGLIPGIAILALSISSFKLWKHGKVDPHLLKVQTAIGTIIFLREWKLYSQRGSFLRLLMLLISGAMAGFYVWRTTIDDQNAGRISTDNNAASDDLSKDSR